MMMLTPLQALVTIGMLTLGTLITRFLPFLCFPKSRPMPKFVLYLSSYLPYTVMGLLVVFCLKNVSVTQSPFGLPELIAIVAIALIHHLKKNSLLSIGGGTIFYMILVQFVFR